MRLAILALLTLGCTTAHPWGPANAYPIDPPHDYQTQWRATEQCSGLTGDFSAIRWYLVPGPSFDDPLTNAKDIGWWDGASRIYLAEAYANNQITLRHEILHALLRHAGHPLIPFLWPCNVLAGS